MVLQHGLTISPKALALLVDHIGNDLSRIVNEIEKLAVNLGARKGITEDDIENYIGISKEFNVFEMQDAIAKKDLAKAIRIIGYFESNPKAAPIILILPAIYNFFSKVFMIFGMANTDDRSVATELGVNPYFVKDYTNAARKYAYDGVERIMLLLHEYNLRSVGVKNVLVHRLMTKISYQETIQVFFPDWDWPGNAQSLVHVVTLQGSCFCRHE